MPSKSRKQARLMAACAHGADYPSCPPARVSKEFNQADKGTGILRSKKTVASKVKHNKMMADHPNDHGDHKSKSKFG